MRIKKNDIFNFGVDAIDVKGTSEKFELINFGVGNEDNYIDTDLYEGFKVKKVNKVMNYKYKIIFRKDGFDCFAYHKGMIQGGVETKDFLSVYGTAFRIFNKIDEIITFIKENIEIKGIRRFDLALDIEIEIKKIHKNFKKKKAKGCIFLNKEREVESFYIGEKKKIANRYKVLRVYNKIEEIHKKRRAKIYLEYLKKETITRIEIEFRAELCANINLEKLGDKKYMFNVFLSYIKQYTDIFNKFSYEEIKLKRLNKKVNIDSLKYENLIHSNYLRNFIGYSKNILEIGACPVDILLRNDLLNETTKKDIFLSIKNGKFRQDFYEFGLSTRNTKSLYSDCDDDVVYIPNQKEND